MNDLLFAVKGPEASSSRPGGRPESPGIPYDVEAGLTTAQSEKSKDMDDFFQEVDGIKRDMTEIKQRQREIAQMHDHSKTIVRQREVQQHRDQMQVRLA
jgi:hypothetical protein